MSADIKKTININPELLDQVKQYGVAHCSGFYDPNRGGEDGFGLSAVIRQLITLGLEASASRGHRASCGCELCKEMR